MSYATDMYQSIQDRADRIETFYATARREFIERRTDEMMAAPGVFLAILSEIIDSSREQVLGALLQKAFAEAGHVWDSLTEIQRMFQEAVQNRAAEEWDAMPRCYESDRAASEADFRRSA